MSVSKVNDELVRFRNSGVKKVEPTGSPQMGHSAQPFPYCYLIIKVRVYHKIINERKQVCMDCPKT